MTRPVQPTQRSRITAMQSAKQRAQQGVMLLEALIAILIFSVGILAVVGMQAVAIKDAAQSKYRSEASFLADSLLSQMWTDAGNIAGYAYAGSGTVPGKLTDWVNDINGKLPGATVVPPIVTITGASSSGATVQIQVRWRMPEETSQGLPPHSHTIIASVFTS